MNGSNNNNEENKSDGSGSALMGMKMDENETNHSNSSLQAIGMNKRRKSKSKLKVLRPRGVIDCNTMIETQFLEFDEPGVFGFAVITSQRTWKFKARSDSERREWIASIHAVNYGVSACM